MTRPLARRLQGIVPFDLVFSDKPPSDVDPHLEIEDGPTRLRVSFSVSPEITCRQFLGIFAPRGGRISCTRKGTGGQAWPADLSLSMASQGALLVVRCALELTSPARIDTQPAKKGTRSSITDEGHKGDAIWTGLDQVAVLARLVHRQRRAEAPSESWSFDGRRVIQEWQTSAGITFREFLKALGNHTTAMLQWRPRFLAVLTATAPAPPRRIRPEHATGAQARRRDVH
ncbi:MAG: hypothetical protein GX442_08630 [Candidatus Riflebacteria bacterium]|nr:hypothetical protein [Candidatus Riflebacteria bacterium]